MDKQRHPRTSPETMDALRVRALRGNKLSELTDGQREWVWRSLLKGVRKAETMALGHFSEEQYSHGVERVRKWYDTRIAQYKASKPKVQVVRPVKPLVKPKRKGIWFWGRNR
jgi:hypothetical protein